MSGQDRFKLESRARRSQGTDEFFRDLKRDAGHAGGGDDEGVVEPVAEGIGVEATEAKSPPPPREVMDATAPAQEVEAVPPTREVEPVAAGARHGQSRADVRPPRASSLPRPASPVDFAEFERRWQPHLKPKQMAVCREIFASTTALGRESYETTGPKLADAVGVKRRQITNLLIQLEEKGFIERDTVKVNKQNKGLLIRFHPIPPKFLLP